MKAWTCAAYGADGNPGDAIAKLELSEIAIPAPGAGQVQVKISHAAVNPIDWKLFSGGLHGICPCTFPYVPGFDVAGTVSAVGEDERRTSPPRSGSVVMFSMTFTRVHPKREKEFRSTTAPPAPPANILPPVLTPPFAPNP